MGHPLCSVQTHAAFFSKFQTPQYHLKPSPIPTTRFLKVLFTFPNTIVTFWRTLQPGFSKYFQKMYSLSQLPIKIAVAIQPSLPDYHFRRLRTRQHPSYLLWLQAGYCQRFLQAPRSCFLNRQTIWSFAKSFAFAKIHNVSDAVVATHIQVLQLTRAVLALFVS